MAQPHFAHERVSFCHAPPGKNCNQPEEHRRNHGNEGPATHADQPQFSDQAEIADYAITAVEKLYMAGVIDGRGDGTFYPVGASQRSEAAKMLAQLITALTR